MKSRIITQLLALAVILCTLAGRVHAVPVPMLTGMGNGGARNDGTYTIGYTFTTGPNEVDVTALGFVDWENGDGLLAAHQVAIWSNTIQIASVTVPAGTAGTFVGQYYYANLASPVRLAPNTTYTIGAEVFADGDIWPENKGSIIPGFTAPDFTGFVALSPYNNVYDASGSFAEPTGAGLGTSLWPSCNLLGNVVSTITTAPLFSPAPGLYFGAQTVTATSEAGSTVFYTTDGSDPTNTSLHGTVGSGSATVNIPVPATMTIKAYATNTAKSDSTIVSAAYTTSATPIPVPMLNGLGNGPARNNVNGTIGYTFTTGSREVDVTALGFVDWENGNGLQAAHQVAIWSNTTQIASVTVPAAGAGTLVSQYYYANLESPVRLAPNTTYTIGAEVFDGGDIWPENKGSIIPGFTAPDFTSFLALSPANNVCDLSGSFAKPTTAGAGSSLWPSCNLLGTLVSSITPTPIFSLPAGSYFGAQTVTMTSEAGSTVFYTTDGSDPTNTSPHGTVGSGSATVNIPVPATMIIKAYATNTDQTASAIVSAAYTTSATPIPVPMLNGLGNGPARNDVYGTIGYTFTTGPNEVNVTALGFADWENGDGLLAAHQVAIWSNTTQIASATVPTGTAGTFVSHYYYANLDSPVRLAANTTYTIGAEVFGGGDIWPDNRGSTSPGFTAPDFTGFLALSPANNVYDVSGSFAEPTDAGLGTSLWPACNLLGVSTVTPPPVFSPAPGLYFGAQTVTMTSEAGATVFYTTDGSDPTATSLHGTVGSGSATVNIPVPATMTIQAYATNTAKSASAIVSAAYTTSATPVPVPMLNGPGNGWARNDVYGTIGYTFTTGPREVDVTALGFMDWENGNGLLAAHQVAIWFSTTQVAWATVPAGTAGTFVSHYYYANLDSPVRLAANTTYTVGAEVFGGGDIWPDNRGSTSPGFTAPDFTGFLALSPANNVYDVSGSFAEPTTAGGGSSLWPSCNLLGNVVPPLVFSGFGTLSGSSFPLTFSGPNGQTYKLLTSTNVSLPMTSWVQLTSGTFGASAVIYTDTSATNVVRFYRIVSP